jgi:hypothetical protein
MFEQEQGEGDKKHGLVNGGVLDAFASFFYYLIP